MNQQLTPPSVIHIGELRFGADNLGWQYALNYADIESCNKIDTAFWCSKDYNGVFNKTQVIGRENHENREWLLTTKYVMQ